MISSDLYRCHNRLEEGSDGEDGRGDDRDLSESPPCCGRASSRAVAGSLYGRGHALGAVATERMGEETTVTGLGSSVSRRDIILRRFSC